jgi:hypothetical protein
LKRPSEFESLSTERITDLQKIWAVRQDIEGLHSHTPDAHWAVNFPMILGNAAERRSDRDWSLHLARHSGRLVAAMFGYIDTYRRRFLRLPIYRVGTEDTADFLLAPDAPREALYALIGRVLSDSSTCAFVEFGGLRQGPRDQLIAAAIELGLRFSSCPSVPAYVFDVSKPFAELFGQMSARLRRYLRSQRKRLEAQHTVDFVSINSTDAATNEALLRSFVDLESMGWKGRCRGAIGSDPRTLEYYRLVTSIESSRGAMWWFALNVDGLPAAMYMCVRSHDFLWMLKTSFDERYTAYSPGNELLVRMLERVCGDEDVRWLHAVTGPEWLRYWHPEVEDRYVVRIFPSTVLGRFCNVAEGFVRRLKEKRPVTRGASEA